MHPGTQEELIVSLDNIGAQLKRVADALETFNSAAITKDGYLFICTEEVGH